VKVKRSRKGEDKYMSSINGMGGSGSPPVSGPTGQQAVTPASASPDSGDYNTGDGEKSMSLVGEDSDTGASEFFAQHMSGRRSGLSTESFLTLHNSAVESASEPAACQEFDLKKMMEMLIALQLLEQLGKSE